jgi:hypothetical protein
MSRRAQRVSRSKDDVSKVLADIFSKAVRPNDGEIERAWARKQRGNPPGKRDDPLGDELSWEQILSHCKDKPRLWIITNDSDYGTVHADKVFLNAALYQELAQMYQSEPTVSCFHIFADGISHFARTRPGQRRNCRHRKKPHRSTRSKSHFLRSVG